MTSSGVFFVRSPSVVKIANAAISILPSTLDVSMSFNVCIFFAILIKFSLSRLGRLGNESVIFHFVDLELGKYRFFLFDAFH